LDFTVALACLSFHAVERGETEALMRLRKKRQDAADKVRKEADENRESRMRRVEFVKEQHAKKFAEREKERKEAEKFFQPDEYRSYLSTFQKDNGAIEAANAAELEKMRKASDGKVGAGCGCVWLCVGGLMCGLCYLQYAADEVVIKQLEAQLKAYDGLQSLAKPQGPKLVETAKVRVMT
jgi:hypothetical protein